MFSRVEWAEQQFHKLRVKRSGFYGDNSWTQIYGDDNRKRSGLYRNVPRKRSPFYEDDLIIKQLIGNNYISYMSILEITRI